MTQSVAPQGPEPTTTTEAPEPERDHRQAPLPGSQHEIIGSGQRQRFELEDSGFREVPAKFRKFYRKWAGAGDELAPNEVLCPTCKVVIRSRREMRPGDRVYCMPCFTRGVVIEGADGTLELKPLY